MTDDMRPTYWDRKSLSLLLEKVLAGDVDHGSFLQDWKGSPSYSAGCGVNAHKAYDGSLDAALALHNAVLPDEGWEVYRTAKYPGMIPGGSREPFAANVGWGTLSRGESANPARALLIAILRALIAQEAAT